MKKHITRSMFAALSLAVALTWLAGCAQSNRCRGGSCAAGAYSSSSNAYPANSPVISPYSGSRTSGSFSGSVSGTR